MSLGGQQLLEYLEKLPGTAFRRLYQSPATALAIFRRMLSYHAKVIVRGLLYMPDPFPLTSLDIWFPPEGDGKIHRDRTIAALRSLHILQVSPPGKDRTQEIQITTSFKKGLQLAFEGGGEDGSFGVPSSLPVDPTIDIAYLDKYARKKWDDILHYVVNSLGVHGSSEGVSGPKASVKELLLAGRLVERRPDTRTGIGITQAGFTFLLQESNAQVWTLLLLWLEAADHTADSGMDSIDMLSFLFMLSSLELGTAYDTSALTETRRNMLPSLVDFGLIYIPRDTRQFYPTRLATTLTSTASALRTVSSAFTAATANPSGEPGTTTSTSGGPAATPDKTQTTAKGIIIETNYRIYAYTTSPLQIAVLALFCQLNMRFPNMVSGRLTRDSIRQAIGFGITADQIISYLHAHAHQQMVREATVTGKPVLPPTVVDQIRLWQLENERMQTTAGFLFKDFESTEEYAALSRYAEEIGVLVWKNDKRQLFFASKHEQLRDYLKSRKKGE
ncbi:RNA polymerase II transcription factor B 52 kDa subunit [Neurospora sp. IMI 360204]|nr:RNA polymerase II transcription factor B 52 kDa subunit [Neurospora sp. IMI 360204]